MITIALNTFKEFLRNKILYIILVSSLILILFSIVLSTLSLREQERIIVDFSLTVIELFWFISTIFLGSYLLYSELTKNTILLILSKSPSRSKFIIWKFIWFSFVLMLIYLFMTASFFLVTLFHSIDFNVYYLIAILLSFIKILVILSLIIFFSTFISPFITLLVSICIYIISHTTPFINFYLSQTWKVVEWTFQYYIVKGIYYIFPNFQDLSMKEFLLSPYLWAHTPLHLASSVFANLLYIAIVLYFAILIFNKKEF